jgi:plastocyanin
MLGRRLSLLAWAGFVAGGCGSGGPPAAAAPVVSVTLHNNTYTPAATSVKVGDTVEWVWADGVVPHNIDGASDLGPFDSGAPKTSGTWTFRFKQVGTFQYHCDVHPAMIGTVTVS